MARPQASALQLWGDVTFQHLGDALLEVAADDGARLPCRRIVEFCAKRWDVPAVCLAAYLLVVWTSRRRPPRKSGPVVDAGFAVWNLALSVFSFWGCWQQLPWLRGMVASHGFYFTVCGDMRTLPTDGSHSILALILFCFSKIPEFGDTAFLILRGKPVRFLQWYHHSTVMLFCWLALATLYTPGVWFAAMNYSVHSVMYMYFFLTYFATLKGFVKRVGPLLTIIQITQMVLGLIINGAAIFHYSVGNDCHVQPVTVHAAVIMYGSYFVLFSQLFFEGRRAKSAGKNGKSQGAQDGTLSARPEQAKLATKVE